MKIVGLFAGKPQPLGPRGNPSAIVKTPVNALTVLEDRTLEDDQANKKLHGGPEKVLHQFSLDSYRTLCAQFPTIEDIAVPGSIGENLVVEGMDDTNVQVGDQYQFGEVILEVSAPRRPCNKIAHRFEQQNMDIYVAENGVTGWYYRVLQTGTITADATVEQIKRHENSVSIRDLVLAVFGDGTPIETIEAYSQLDALDDEWRQKCERRALKLRREKAKQDG